MKISKLLVSGVLLIASSGVGATVVDGVRQKPVPEKAAFQYGEVLYLYNVASKQYYCGANDWETRASVSETGWKVKVTKFVTDSTEWDGQTVIVKDSVVNGSYKGKWLKAWFTTSQNEAKDSTWLDGGLYTDHNGQADTLWTISQLDGNIVRLGASPLNTDYDATRIASLPSFVGVDLALDGGGNTRLWAFLSPSVATNAIDWYFVTPEAYAANQEALAVFEVAQALKAQIDAAKSRGIDVSAQVAVYENEASTIDELNAAIVAVKEAVAAYEESHVDVNSPVDKTADLLVNADYASANNTGWEGTAPAFGYGAAELYNKTYNTYQKVANAPNGVYAINLQAYYRAGWCTQSYANYNNNNANALAKLYAVSANDTVQSSIMNMFADARDSRIGTGTEKNEKGSTTDETGVAFVPDNMQAAAAYFEEGRYAKNTVFFGTDNHEFLVGLIKTTTLDGDWTMFDNWKLTYYGNSAAAYQKWQDQAMTDAFDTSTLPEGTLVTVGTIEAYNTLKSTLAAPTCKADVIANIKKVTDAANALLANVEAWKAYKAAYDAAGATIADEDVADGELKESLGDLQWAAEDDLNSLTLTTEEVVEKTNALLAANENCIKNSIKAGADVTDKFLVNARYEDGANGWNGSPTVNGPANNKCAEKWNTAFDVYQEVKDAPVGVYSVSLQGFYRPGDNAVAWPIYAENMAWTKSTSINVYVNNNTSTLKNLYDERVKKGELFQTTNLTTDNPPYEVEIDPVTLDSAWFANDMTNAGIAFSNGMYTSTAFGLVAKAGDVLRIGVKGALDNANQWVCWDNFKMVFQGFKADIIAPELAKSIAHAKTFIVNDAPAEYMTKTAFDQLKTAIAGGETAQGGNEGKEMFKALSALYEAIEKANASIAACKELVAAAEKMNTIALSSDCPASTATKNEAAALYSEVMEGLEDCTLEDADIEKLATKIADMTITLRIPEGTATDENPFDLTALVQTPDFSDENGANSAAGWTGANGNFGNDDTQKAALLYEYYEKSNVDLYQDIIGLPNGTYQVSANAFCRMGSSSDDAKAFEANPDTLSNALLYAFSADSVLHAVGIMPVSACALTEKLEAGSETEVTINGTTMYVPNDMVSSSAYFEMGKYVNTVTVKVTGKQLRIGLRKTTKQSSDWVIIDNFKLMYFGENSAKNPSGDPTGINSIGGDAAKVAKVEFFSVNGARNASLVKGINIMKTTMADGRVVVSKIMVK